MTVTINIDGKDFEMNYADIAKIAQAARETTVKAMKRLIRNSENGMTTSELVAASGFTRGQVYSLMQTISGGWDFPIKEELTKTCHRFVEIDENGNPIKNGQTIEHHRWENKYTYKK